MELLLNELMQVGLEANVKKTKILTNNIEYMAGDYVEILENMVEVLSAAKGHRYLGRILNLHADERVELELEHRRKQAWAAFHKFRKILLNHDLSLRQRLRLFDCVCTASAIFGLGTFPMTSQQRSSMGITQRRMLRSIVGWRRIPDESWHETMRRMNARMERAMKLHFVNSWECQILYAWWRYAIHLALSDANAPWKILLQWDPRLIQDPTFEFSPHRMRGRPRTRWDDDLREFSIHKFGYHKDWTHPILLNYEEHFALREEYVIYIMHKESNL